MSDPNKRIEIAVTKAKSIIVTTTDQSQAAQLFLKSLSELKKQVKDFTAPSVKAAHEAHKAAKAMQNSALKPVEDAYSIVSVKIGQYEAAERRHYEAEECARVQRERAEQDRLSAMSKDEREDEGVTGVPEVVPVRIHKPVKLEGVRTIETWKYRIVDEGKVPREYCSPDSKKINAIVKTWQGERGIPGVEIFKETKATATAGR